MAWIGMDAMGDLVELHATGDLVELHATFAERMATLRSEWRQRITSIVACLTEKDHQSDRDGRHGDRALKRLDP